MYNGRLSMALNTNFLHSNVDSMYLFSNENLSSVCMIIFKLCFILELMSNFFKKMTSTVFWIIFEF